MNRNPPLPAFPLSLLRCVLALLALPLAAGGNDSAAPDKPAPQTDRVGFPKEYATQFTELRKFDRGDHQVVTVYGNAAAARVKGLADLPFPNDSILVMETAEGARNPNGAVEKQKVVGLHVMRRGPDFGTAYGTNRAGPWEFVEYRADGSYLTPPAKSAACAECHVKAGRDRDYVYRGPLPKAAP